MCVHGAFHPRRHRPSVPAPARASASQSEPAPSWSRCTVLHADEQPTRGALTLQSAPTFVTGWGAGNIVSDPTRGTAAEELVAHGFGTLRARAGANGSLEATGVYATGTYRVMFKRALSVKGSNAARLRAGGTVPIAFAVWNGSAGDRDGKKSVTIWQDLRLEP